MPPKSNKKLSKKERKALKKELREKKKEEARKLAEERKRLAEEEAKRLEEEARLAWEAEQARLRAEQERISLEREGLGHFFNWRTKALADYHALTASLDDWTRFVNAGDLPHPSHEEQMNNFFNLLETTSDQDFNSTLPTINNIHKVLVVCEDLCQIEKQKGSDLAIIKSLDSYVKKLDSILQKRLDFTTANQLMRSHEVWKQSSESTFYAMSEEAKIYLWVNHAKNPRLRVLNEANLNLTIGIPKALTFSNVGVRVYQQYVDPPLISRNVYRSLGGAFVLDVLSIPAPSRSTKGWTFEHVTSMTTSVVRLGCPGEGAAPGSGSPSPLSLEFVIPSTVIIATQPPEVGWWNEEEELWDKDSITDIEYNASSRILKFQTIRARTHAIIQSRVHYYPYESWIATPLSEKNALLTLNSHGHIIKIEIGEGWCKLKETPFPECSHIVGEQLDPLILLKKMSRCGLQLMPEDADAEIIKGYRVSVKEANVEHYACDDLSLALPTCAIASSKWNAIADKDSCVVRILEIPEPKFPPTFEKSKNVKMMLYKAKGNAMLNMTEKQSQEYKEEIGGEYHASLLVTLREFISQECISKIETGDPAFTECFKRLAIALRLFSFTSTVKVVEPPPVPQPNEEVPAGEAPPSELAPSNEGAVPTSETAPSGEGKQESKDRDSPKGKASEKPPT